MSSCRHRSWTENQKLRSKHRRENTWSHRSANERSILAGTRGTSSPSAKEGARLRTAGSLCRAGTATPAIHCWGVIEETVSGKPSLADCLNDAFKKACLHKITCNRKKVIKHDCTCPTGWKGNVFSLPPQLIPLMILSYFSHFFSSKQLDSIDERHTTSKKFELA